MVHADGASVRVAWAGIRARLDHPSGMVYVQFRPYDAPRWSPVDGQAVMAAVDAARLHANEHVGAGGLEEVAECWNISPSPYGPLLWLDRVAPEEEGTHAWVTTFAAHLGEAGFWGTVECAEAQVWLPGWMDDPRYLPRLTAFVAYTLDQPFTDLGPGSWHQTWGVDPSTTQALCRDVADWCAELKGGEAYLSQGLSQVLLDGPDLPQILAASVPYGPAGLTYARREPRAVRQARLSQGGQCVYQIEDAGKDWRGRLDTLTRVLTWQPQAFELAIVRLTPSLALSWLMLDLKNPPPPTVDTPRFFDCRSLWREFTPDAHGIQILTDAHLARARSLTGWNVNPVAGGRYLVQARDLEPWYSGTQPDPDVLAAARADFADMILTPSAIDAHTRP